MEKYYVYSHIRLDTGDIFYIGKGCNNRAWHKYNRGNHWDNIVNKAGYVVKMVKDNMTEGDSIELEIELISRYGRKDLGLGCLINLTNGGDGLSGHARSLDTKRKMSIAQKGIPKTEKHKANMWMNRYQYIQAVDAHGNAIGVYKSIKECTKQLFPDTKSAKSSISKLMRGIYKNGSGNLMESYKGLTFNKVDIDE